MPTASTGHPIRTHPPLGRDAIGRVLDSLVRWELAALFRRRGEPAPERVGARTPLGEAGVGLDSIELIGLGTAVAEYFHLGEAGNEDNLLRRPTLERWRRVVLDARACCDERITFRTSGSTGDAQPCTHALAALRAEALEFAALHAPHAPRRVVLAAPAHHIYGFIHGTLVPAALGVPVVDAAGWGPGQWRRGLQAGDIVTSHPLLWASIAQAVPRLRAGVRGVTSTAPCDPALIGRLRDQGLDAMIDVYGASETAGIGWRDDPHAPYALLSRWERATDGADGATRLRAAGADPAGPTAPAWGSAAPVEPVEPVESAEPVELADRIEWVGARALRPAGRRDGAVQVGGVNVWPARIARRIAGWPGVAACVVRPMAPHEGMRLKAFVVLVPQRDEAAARAAVAARMRRELPAPERCALAFGAALPRNAAGESCDWPLDGAPGSLAAPIPVEPFELFEAGAHAGA